MGDLNGVTDTQVTTAEQETKFKRPGWVWVISFYYVLSVLWSSIALYALSSGGIHVTPEGKQYFASLNMFDYALSVFQSLLSLSAAVMLFLLRKVAYPLFCTAFVVALASILWNVFARNWLAAMKSMRGGLLGALIGMAILFAVCFYTRRLSETGKLR